jgi:hypothetical protein
MLRSQPQASQHCAFRNRRLIRTSTAVSRRAERHGSVPDCSDTRSVHFLQALHEPRHDAHTTDATDNGFLAIQYYGYLIVDLYHRSRTHLSLGKDSSEPRPVQPPAMGSVVAVPRVGGLHHRYERWVAYRSPNLPGCALPILGALAL